MEVQSLIATRLGGRSFGEEKEIYKFEKIKRAKREAMRKHPEMPLIDLGVGEPDQVANEQIIEVLRRECSKPENRGYADNGIEAFQKAAGKYLEEVYGVSGINPSTQIIHGIGSKPILAMLPMCVINPGDITLLTTPGYPIIGTYTKYLGGEVYELPLKADHHFLPELDKIPDEILKKAKLLYINYPNNPTGAVATKEFFEEVVAFAKKNNILVVHDAAYGAIVFDKQPLSFLSIEGATEVGVEIHSLSKAFSMTGWRLAFVAGNEMLIKAYGTVKDNTDSGQFIGIQKAGAYALSHPEITRQTCKHYEKRMNLLCKALNELGFDAVKPKGSFYCYVEAPKGAKDIIFKSAEEVAEYFIKEALISVVPWDEEKAYLRFSVTYEGNDEEMMDELKKRLSKLELVF